MSHVKMQRNYKSASNSCKQDEQADVMSAASVVMKHLFEAC
jgi:hypothetical protein